MKKKKKDMIGKIEEKQKDWSSAFSALQSMSSLATEEVPGPTKSKPA